MPITFHDDLVFLQSTIPDVTEGDISFFAEYEKKYNPFPNTNPSYPPLYYFIAGSFRVLENRFSSQLTPWIERCWAFYCASVKGDTGGFQKYTYFDDPGGYKIFRNLFLVKSHYLLFDFLVALLIIIIVPEKRKKILALAFWMFNPFVILTTFAQGQHDIMATGLLFLAFYLSLKKKPGPALALLSVGFMIKIFPVFFILPLILYFSKDRMSFLKLSAWAAIPLILVLVPLYEICGGAIIKFFYHPNTAARVTSGGFVHLVQKGVVLGGYLALLFWAAKKKFSSDNETLQYNLLKLYATVSLLLCMGMGLEIRYFVWVSPFIVMLAVRDRNLMYLALLQITSLWILRYIPTPGLQFRLFAPLFPELFNAIPSLEQCLSEFLSATSVYRLTYRVFLLSSLFLAITFWWPEYLEKYLKGKYIRAFAVFGSLVLLVSVSGIITYGALRLSAKGLPGNGIKSFSWEMKAEMKRSALEDRDVFVAVLRPYIDGLYSIDRVALSNAGVLFRPRSVVGASPRGVREEFNGKVYAEGYSFEPLRYAGQSGLQIEIPASSLPRSNKGFGRELSALGRFIWVYNLSQSIDIILRRLEEDRGFFLFYVSSLLALFLLSTAFLASGIIVHRR